MRDESKTNISQTASGDIFMADKNLYGQEKCYHTLKLFLLFSSCIKNSLNYEIQFNMEIYKMNIYIYLNSFESIPLT